MVMSIIDLMLVVELIGVIGMGQGFLNNPTMTSADGDKFVEIIRGTDDRKIRIVKQSHIWLCKNFNSPLSVSILYKLTKNVNNNIIRKEVHKRWLILT